MTSPAGPDDPLGDSTHELAREGQDADVVVKRYRVWNDDQPRREWIALQLLDLYAPGFAPGPVSAELDGMPPTVRMRHLPGRPLGGEPLTDEQLSAIGVGLDRLHTCIPAGRLRELQ